jgi:Spy/CpxP family protein refolding chaperone
MSKRLLVLGVALVVVLGLVAVAAANPSDVDSESARPFGFGVMGRCFGGDPPKAPDLGLTDEQAAAIGELQDQAFASVEALRREISQKQYEFQKLLWQKEPDQAAIDAKWEELQALREEMLEETQRLREEMNEVLTDEQLDKLGEFRLGGGARGGCGMGVGIGRRIRDGNGREVRARGV